MNDPDMQASTTDAPDELHDTADEQRDYLCDRCGFEMIERHCKVVCPNCGARWDCSDLSIYAD